MKRKNMTASALPADFDPLVYLDLHQDVRLAKVDAVTHYLTYGAAEGRTYKRPEANTFEKTLAEFLTIPPSEQNAFDLFAGAWSSDFSGVTTQGSFKGEDDARIKWLPSQFDVFSKSVLELGPLESKCAQAAC